MEDVMSRKTTSPVSGFGDFPEPGKGSFTYPMTLMMALTFVYIAYLLHIGFTPRDALVFAICSTAVLGGVSYLPNGLIKLMRALGQQ
jgi:hypothetical protein